MDEAAPAIGGPFGIPNSMMAAAAGSPEDIETLFGRLDRRRARGLGLQLQRSVGNRYVMSIFRGGPTVQRDGPSTPSGPRNSYGFQGIEVSSDKTSLRTQFEELVERNGLSKLRSWTAAFFGLSEAEKQAVAIGMSPAEIKAVDEAVGDTGRELESDARSYADSLKPSATLATTEILDESEKRIRGELDKYGIKEREIPPDESGGGGAEGAPPAYDKQVSTENAAAAQDAQGRAKELAKARRAADVAQQKFLPLASVPGLPEIERAVEKEIPELDTAYKEAENLWKTAEDEFAKRAMAATREFPVLAMYASGPDAANQLESFGNQPVEQLGETIWREARTRLDNIETIRSGLGKQFDPLSNHRIVQMVLDKEGTKPWQKRVGQDEVAAVKEKAEDNQMFWATLAMGLGIIAALPTGGTSIAAAGIVTAAAVAGAALTAYNAYEHWKDYQVQSAGAKTDFDKAQSISKDEPSFFWLALDILAAGVDVIGAAAAFKNLVKVVKEVRATKDLAQFAKTVDAVAPPSVRPKLKAKIAEELGPRAQAELAAAEKLKVAAAEKGVTKAIGDVAPDVRKAAMLESPESLKKLIETAGAVELAWGKKFVTAEARAQSLLDLVNERLAAAGVPKLKGVELGGGTGASFDQRLWRMELSRALLSKATITEQDFAKLLNHAYHEARHGEQFFTMARREAGMAGKTVDDLIKGKDAGGLAIDPDVAKAAMGSKLAPDSAEALMAAEWYESIYGTGRAARRELLSKIDDAVAHFEQRRSVLDMYKADIKKGSSLFGDADVKAATDAMNEAYAKYEVLHSKYKLLPEEADAWRVGDEAERLYLEWVDEQMPATVRPGR